MPGIQPEPRPLALARESFRTSPPPPLQCSCHGEAGKFLGANIDEPTCTSDFHQVQYEDCLFRLALFPFGWDGRLIRCEGEKALHLSAVRKHKVARVLLAHRARTDIENSEGTTVEKLEWHFRPTAAKEKAEIELSQKNYSPKSKFGLECNYVTI